MKRKRISRVLGIGVVLLLALFYFTENKRTRFTYTPEDWRISIGPQMIWFHMDGQITSYREFHVGPIVIIHDSD
jgi:hypothetical protein